jgi:hypothetical protein
VPKQLRRSHRLTWISVILFLIDYFVNMVIFCVQRGPFTDWCLSKSRADTIVELIMQPYDTAIFTSQNITNGIHTSQQVTGFTAIHPGSDLYNCSRLWEDEIKFSVVVFVIMFALYVRIRYNYKLRDMVLTYLIDSFCILLLVLHARSYGFI